MSAAAPTFSQIKAQVSAIRRKVEDARVIGIRSTGRWTGEREKTDGKTTYVIEQCDSPLQIRIALQAPVPDGATKVVITPLSDNELGDDVRVRLAKRRLFPVDSWQIVGSLFQVRAIDPRLTRHPWMADRLLEFAPPSGYPPVAGGFLDAETVWPILLREEIDFTAERPDLLEILKWSIEPERIARFRALPEAFRSATIEWMTQVAGPTAQAVLKCVLACDRPDALPVGLAAGVVYAPQTKGKLERAEVLLEERFLGGAQAHGESQTRDISLIQRWHAAATEVVSLQITEPRKRQALMHRADEILREVQAERFAYHSNTSPLGFHQRLARFGESLSELLRGNSISSVDVIQEAREQVIRHELARHEPRRLQSLQMAVRLVRWCQHWEQYAEKEPSSFVEAAQRHVDEGGFVDWARYTLRSGDPVRELSEAYARLWDCVLVIREQQSRQFASLLQGWTAAGSGGRDVIPVERFMEQVIAPIAAESPVLVIVIDGMSVAVCRELVTDLTRQDWVPMCEESRHSNRPAIATIPSVTEVSRTSLFCGSLRQGAASDEEVGFAAHPALLPHCRSGHPPIVFHKVRLQDDDDASLSISVRNEIGSPQRRIVAVVINAVDDHLLKGQQLDIRWSRDEIKALPTLLYEAKAAGRVVVLVSDHGHILDHGTKMGPAEASERWRPAEGLPVDGELLIEGSRVQLAAGHRLIAPWSERIRYSRGNRNGYHGGITPQEMVIPITILTSNQQSLKGWTESHAMTPDWWEESVSEQPAEQPPVLIKPIRKKDPGMLFDLDDEVEAAKPDQKIEPKSTTPPTSRPWVTALLTCPVFTEQKKLGGRGLPTDEVFAKLLSSLDERGGKMTCVALARTLEFPEMRLAGLLAKVERVLNLDGYDVLRRDDTSDTIELNRDLLLKQFDLVE